MSRLSRAIYIHYCENPYTHTGIELTFQIMGTESKQDKRSAALRANLKRRKEKTKAIKQNATLGAKQRTDKDKGNDYNE